ncbi:DUF397 domain-containing protein [Streptomyces sp. NBC_00996]|uniref:DUF397 domain-containing protein n=1 Tax=Streptomyces sp. NBC_00996 TaxID=2903710 RepID=UPI00386BAB1A|nr:DUF397 domain-containing protein [Streptomyces sp. NBC_00996]
MRSSEPVSIPDASVVPMWRKSSYSGGDSGECLEVNDSRPAHVPVRDSKNPHGPAVVFTAGAWTAFVTAVRTASVSPHHD